MACSKQQLKYTRYIQLLTLYNEGDITAAQSDELDQLEDEIAAEQEHNNS